MRDVEEAGVSATVTWMEEPGDGGVVRPTHAAVHCLPKRAGWPLQPAAAALANRLPSPPQALGNQGNRQEMPPPPINQSSSLMALQPRATAGDSDISMTQPATFDIQNLQLALTRSQQTSSSTGLRCGDTLERTQQPEAHSCTAMLGHLAPPAPSLVTVELSASVGAVSVT